MKHRMGDVYLLWVDAICKTWFWVPTISDTLLARQVEGVKYGPIHGLLWFTCAAR
jgi:hypothetical protein